MKSKKDLIYCYTLMQIERIKASTKNNSGKEVLANLRHGIGKEPGELPQIWGMFLLDIPEELIGNNSGPSKAEWAIYLALTMYALHQQGKDVETDFMYKKGNSLGKSVGMLIDPELGIDDERERVMRRFSPLITASGIDEVAHYLRGMVQLLSTKAIPLDYPAVAVDLYRYQYPEAKSSVQLNWGEDFYRQINILRIKEKKNNDGE